MLSHSLMTYGVSWQVGYISLIFIVPRIKIYVESYFVAVTTMTVCHIAPHCNDAQPSYTKLGENVTHLLHSFQHEPRCHL